LDLFCSLFPASRIFHEASSPVRDGFLRSAAEGDILHIASHYQYDPVSPELARFALTLSPSKTNASEPLYAFEVASLHLKSALTVLSACSTGRGEIQPGEGLINMGRAFLLAGSRSVITSMWPVEEESTAAVLGHFYRYLATGLDSREALRQAKLRMLEVPRWQHPFYWGAFILSGSPMRLVQGESPAADSKGPGIQKWFSQMATEAAAIMGGPGLK
jgi:CHAT domain-containing protein